MLPPFPRRRAAVEVATLPLGESGATPPVGSCCRPPRPTRYCVSPTVAGCLQVPPSSSVISTPVGSAGSPSVYSTAAPHQASMSNRATTAPLRLRATLPPSGPRTARAPAEAITGRDAPLTVLGELAPRRCTHFPSFMSSRITAGTVPLPCRIGAHPPPRRGHALQAATAPAMANQPRRRKLIFMFYTCCILVHS
jgi:hypothetical protein